MLVVYTVVYIWNLKCKHVSTLLGSICLLGPECSKFGLHMEILRGYLIMPYLLAFLCPKKNAHDCKLRKKSFPEIVTSNHFDKGSANFHKVLWLFWSFSHHYLLVWRAALYLEVTLHELFFTPLWFVYSTIAVHCAYSSQMMWPRGCDSNTKI